MTTPPSTTAGAQLSPDQVAFTNAFNRQRPLLAAFANCANQDDLHIIRDGLYLGLAHELALPEYMDHVKPHIVTNLASSVPVAPATPTQPGMANMVHLARTSSAWQPMVDAVLIRAALVDCDLTDLWMTLETGRLEWLQAVSAAHSIKLLLREGLRKENSNPSQGDISDAKMIWIYALCCTIPSLQANAVQWAKVVQMPNPKAPLVGYQPELWDPRKEEWRPLDVGAQAAAERGGSTLEQAWEAE